MIVSFTHEFVFVKTRKTAGTSVEIVLSAWLGEADIASPITPADELLRRDYGGRPRNFAEDPAEEAALLAAIAGGDPAAVAAVMAGRRWRFRNHFPASRIRAALPRDFWVRAFKFAVERHPYDKALSFARYKHQATGGDVGFADFLDAQIELGRYRNFDLYADRDGLLVDEVIRYDRLWPRLEELAARWGQLLPQPLPRAKRLPAADGRPAAEILSPAQKRRVREVCAEEFALFGFEP